MELDIPEVKNYLLELYGLTEGDTGRQASMYEVGERTGLEKAAAGSMAENLIVQGWVELVTLSGGISITTQGIEQLQLSGIVAGDAGSDLQLGPGPFVDKSGRENIEKIVAEVKDGILSTKPSFPQLEEIIFDIKTIEVHLLSPKPKVEVVRQLFRSLHESLTALKIENIAAKLGVMVSS